MALQFPEWFPRHERAAYRRAYRDVAERAVRIVAVSQRVADDLVEVLGVARERIAVIHEAAGAEFLASQPQDEVAAVCRGYDLTPGRYLIAVGAVSERKNMGPVLRAVAARPGVTLALAGPEGHGADVVAAEVARLDIGARVHRLGYVAAAHLPPLVAGARALVHPATYEGFGLPPLEAMAVGTPVIASAAGSLPEVVGEAGVLVAPDDDDAWRAAVERMYDDDALCASLADAGRARAMSFSWQRAAAETAAVHRACLDQ
jgi:glycosyltransferase involved in cell wall biosynthesis